MAGPTDVFSLLRVVPNASLVRSSRERRRALAGAPKQAARLSFFSQLPRLSRFTSPAINLFRLYDRFKIIPRSGVHLVKA